MCEACGNTKPVSEFRRHWNSPDGYVKQCNACYAASQVRAAEEYRRKQEERHREQEEQRAEHKRHARERKAARLDELRGVRLTQDEYLHPAQIVEYTLDHAAPWARHGRCAACDGEFTGPTYYYVRFMPRRRSGPPYYSGTGMDACSRGCAELLARTPRRGGQLETEGRPSGTTRRSVGWIYAFREVGDYPDDAERSGKWMVFWKPDEIDAAWECIREAVRSGRLGYRAKVATQPSHWRTGVFHVVCVYTYDSDDVEDVRRVRAELRHLGVTRKIGYKEDEETRQGHYSSNGRRVSKYWE